MNLKKVKLENLKTMTADISNCSHNRQTKDALPKNMYFSGERLKTRLGAAPFGDVIFNSEETYNNYEKTIFTDCHYYKNGLKGRIFIIVNNDEISNITYYFYIMWSSGEVTCVGQIEFTSASETTFGRPETFTLYTGKATRGCGIYFLVRLVYGDGSEDFVKLYELNEDMSEWQYVYSGDIYIPTVLAFGRGQNYYRAEELDSRISLSKTINPEAENILTDEFLAYYTTEGYSAAFQLPYSSIGQGAVSCVYNDFINEYHFSIDYGQSLSKTVVIDSKSYRLGCNRNNGIIYFVDENNVSIALPYTGFENNLKVLASRVESDDMIKLGAMSKSMSIPAGREGSGNQTVIFYGNELSEGGKICWINSENPLYFPKSCIATPGNISGKLEGAYVHSNNLYLFDKENLYTASVHTANNFDLALILKGVLSANEADYDKITFNGTTSLPGEIIKDTVVTFSDRVLFTLSNGEVYEQKGNTAPSFKKVAELYLYDFLPDCAVSYKGGYLLTKGTDAYYYDIKNECIFYWQLVADIIAGFSFSDECILFAKCIYNDYSTIIYEIQFKGDTDRAIWNFVNKPLYSFSTVWGKITCEFDIGDIYYKRLHTIVIDVEPCQNQMNVNIFDGQNLICSRYDSFETGNMTIRYGARFKKLRLEIVGPGLSFTDSKIVYYDGKTV